MHFKYLFLIPYVMSAAISTMYCSILLFKMFVTYVVILLRNATISHTIKQKKI